MSDGGEAGESVQGLDRRQDTGAGEPKNREMGRIKVRIAAGWVRASGWRLPGKRNGELAVGRMLC